MLGHNEHSVFMRKAAAVLLTSACAILASTASAQTARPAAQATSTAPVQIVEVINKIPMDVTRAFSFEHESCDKAKVAQCSKATIFVFSAPLIEISNVAATSGGSAKLAAGSTLTYHVTITNNGPGSASNIKLVEAPRAGVNCPDSGVITAISGSALPSGKYTIADLTGPGIPLTKLDLGQSTTLTYSCQVN
jgi:uncharacterized repeat protein (TIGR01451 family)